MMLWRKRKDDASSLIEILIDTLIELYFLAETGRKLYFTAPETSFYRPGNFFFPPENQTRLIVLFCVE